MLSELAGEVGCEELYLHTNHNSPSPLSKQMPRAHEHEGDCVHKLQKERTEDVTILTSEILCAYLSGLGITFILYSKQLFFCSCPKW